MRIALDEIDPHIAAMYAVTAPTQTARASAPTRQRIRLSRRRRIALTASLVVPPMVGFQLAVMAASASHQQAAWLPWVVWLGTWTLGASVGSRLALKGHRVSRQSAILVAVSALTAPSLGIATAFKYCNTRPYFAFWMTWLMVSLSVALLGNLLALSLTSRAATVTALQTENMRDVFASISLTRAERVYCDVLMFLARAQPNEATQQTMRETLGQLNVLVESSRQLEEQRLALLPLLGANVVPELRAEFDRLNQRLEATNDPITRSSLEQSRRMVVSRIEDAHNLQTGLERLNTQQEAVTQTLSSALSSLGRMQITSNPNTEFAMSDIADSVTHMNQQTVAVEHAVEEVLTLRASN